MDPNSSLSLHETNDLKKIPSSTSRENLNQKNQKLFISEIEKSIDLLSTSEEKEELILKKISVNTIFCLVVFVYYNNIF